LKALNIFEGPKLLANIWQNTKEPGRKAVCQWREKELPRTLISAGAEQKNKDRGAAKLARRKRNKGVEHSHLRPFGGACRLTEQLGQERRGNTCIHGWGGSVGRVGFGSSRHSNCWRWLEAKGKVQRSSGIGRKDADIYLTLNARNLEIWYARKLDNWPGSVMGVDLSSLLIFLPLVGILELLLPENRGRCAILFYFCVAVLTFNFSSQPYRKARQKLSHAPFDNFRTRGPGVDPSLGR